MEYRSFIMLTFAYINDIEFRLPASCDLKDAPKLLPTENDIETVVLLLRENK